jgi:hypothetical protein
VTVSFIEDLAQRFDTDRRRLRSVVFHLLGSVANAEDAVQSAWLKASRPVLRPRLRDVYRPYYRSASTMARIHSIDIVGDAGRLDSAAVALPEDRYLTRPRLHRLPEIHKPVSRISQEARHDQKPRTR